MNFSPSYISGLAILIVSVLELLKIKVIPTDIEPIIVGVASLILLVRRFKKGDLTIYGKIKKHITTLGVKTPYKAT